MPASYQTGIAVSVTVGTPPVQVKVTILVRRGHGGFRDPALVLRNLLINPQLQLLLILRSPRSATHLLAELLLAILERLRHCLIRQVGADHHHPSSRRIPRIVRHRLLVAPVIRRIHRIPKHLPRVHTKRSSRAVILNPLRAVLQMLRRVPPVLVRHEEAIHLAATPPTIRLIRRRHIAQPIRRRHNTRRLMDQAVIIPHALRQLHPDAQLLTQLITPAITRTNHADRRIRQKLTLHPTRIHIRLQLQRKVPVLIHLRIKRRRRMLRIHALIPLREHTNRLPTHRRPRPRMQRRRQIPRTIINHHRPPQRLPLAVRQHLRRRTHRPRRTRHLHRQLHRTAHRRRIIRIPRRKQRLRRMQRLRIIRRNHVQKRLRRLHINLRRRLRHHN